MNISVLSAGAAKALVQTVELQLLDVEGLAIQGSFGAVGTMQDKLLAGEPCDLTILSESMIRALAAQNRVVPDSCALIGTVRTGLAVAAGSPVPLISDPSSLAAALGSASAVYFPDPEKATAGIHFKQVIEKLGLKSTLKDRLRPFPNGATAMRELADSQDHRAIGCTQVTEILYTPGVRLIGALPPPFSLETRYALAVSTAAAQPKQARILAELIVGPQNSALRRDIGFE